MHEKPRRGTPGTQTADCSSTQVTSSDNPCAQSGTPPPSTQAESTDFDSQLARQEAQPLKRAASSTPSSDDVDLLIAEACDRAKLSFRENF